jgi:omega-amidase
MTIIPGAFYQKIKKEITISSPVIGPKGSIIGRQEKIHPFDYGGKTVTAEKEVKIFNTGCKFGIIICYDMVFPKVSETFVKKGAQILFSPSGIVKRGIKSWQHMFKQNL